MTSGSRRLPQLAAFLGAVGVLALVAGSGSAWAQSSATAAKPRGTVRVAYVDFGRDLLSPLGVVRMGTRGYGEALYDPLVGVNADGSTNFNNGLLTRIETSDAQFYTLALRQGVKFHDGTDLTAEDVKWTMDYIVETKDVGGQSAIYLRANLDKVEVIDAHTLKVSLKRKDVEFPTMIAPVESDLVIYPKAYFLKATDSGFEKKPVGSGPWKFSKRQLGEYIEYEANENYWNKARVPGFKTLRLELVPDITSRKAKLRAGEIDLIQINPSDAPQMEKDGFRIVGPRYTAYPMVNFMQSGDTAFLTNKLDFRKAIVLAVDMPAVVKGFYPPGTAEPTTGTPGFSPVTMGYDASLPAYKYDPEESKRLLKSAGYNGELVSFYNMAGFPGAPEMPEVNVAIANYLRQVGLNVKLIDVDFTTFSPSRRVVDPPAALIQTGAQPRPSLLGNIRVYMLAKSDGGAVAAASEAAKIKTAYDRISAIVDVKERDNALRAFGKDLYNDYWAMPVVWRHGGWAASKRIAGWEPVNGTSDYLRFDTLKPSESVRN